MKRLFAIAVAVLALSLTAADARHSDRKGDRLTSGQTVTIEHQAVDKSLTTQVCKVSAFSGVTRDVITRINKLVEQYDATKAELASVAAAPPGKLEIYPAASLVERIRVDRKPLYTDDGPELSGVVQSILKKRLAAIDCELRKIGVNIGDPQQLSSLM